MYLNSAVIIMCLKYYSIVHRLLEFPAKLLYLMYNEA